VGHHGTADVDHLGHDASTEILGLLWSLSYVGTCRAMYQTIGNAFSRRQGRTSLFALELSACDVSQYSVRYEYLLWARPTKVRC